MAANPKKKKARKSTTTKKRRRRARRNPSTKTIVRRARSNSLFGPVEGAARNMGMMMLGAMAAKAIQRRAGNGKSEAENWEWKDYAWASAGVLGASVLAKSVLKRSTADQQRILEGGMLMILFKAVTQELVPMSETATKWLGDDDNYYSPGDEYVTQTGETYVLGSNGSWSEQSNIPRLVGATIEDEPEVLLGEGAGPVTSLGEGVTPVTNLGDYGPVWHSRPAAGAVW